MPSLPKQNPRPMLPIWTYAGWTVCGVVAVAVTLASMGRWPHAAPTGAPPVAIRTTAPARTDTGNRVTAAPSLPPSSSGPGIDVLSRLEAAARSRDADALQANPSNTMTEALQRALSYPGFSALAGRSDAEGLVEAAAWADACARDAMVAQERLLRCSDTRLRGAHVADELLVKAADAGQPAAVLTLAERNPAQWMEIPLPGGEMLGDRVFGLAAHGNPAALALLSQWCANADACTDARLTRNVLALLQLSIFKTGTSEPAGYLTGSDSERHDAFERAARLRAALKWAS